MVVRQPSYSWVPIVVFVLILLMVLLGYLLANQISPATLGAAAPEATRTAVAQLSKDLDLQRQYTATAMAAQSENDQVLGSATRAAITAAPTQTAAAQLLQQQRDEANAKAMAEALPAVVRTIALVCGLAAAAGLLVWGTPRVLDYRLRSLAVRSQLQRDEGRLEAAQAARIAEEARLRQCEIKLEEAKATRVAEEARLERERRRTVEVELVVNRDDKPPRPDAPILQRTPPDGVKTKSNGKDKPRAT